MAANGGMVGRGVYRTPTTASAEQPGVTIRRIVAVRTFKGIEQSCAILSPRLSAGHARIIRESRGTMTEILTESFCERCGTRYTFESARPRTRLKGVKVLSRGLRNFVLSDDTSIDEAMASARSEADREASSHQLDAFHKTFNFCMSCRQYTCPNCWNEAEARCLSCAPLAIAEIPHPVHELPELGNATLIGEAAATNGAPAIEDAAEAWPAVTEPERVEAGWDEGQAETAEDWHAATTTSDDSVGDLAEPQVEAIDEPFGAAEQPSVEADDIATAEPVAAAAEPVSAAESADAAETPAAGETGDPADKAASQTLGLLQRFRPGQSLDAELDAYERERGEAPSADVAAAADAPMDDLGALHTERLAAASASVEPAAAIEAEGLAADTDVIEPPADVADEHPFGVPEVGDPIVEPAPEPVAAEATPPEPTQAPEEPAAAQVAATAADVVEQPTWRITAPDPTAAPPATPGIDQGGAVPTQPSPARPAGEPQWPARPEWPSATAGAGLPFLGRPATPQGGIDALWAASNQELVTAPPVAGKVAGGIQPCISCGLSLSATARFCRRCGTLQAR